MEYRHSILLGGIGGDSHSVGLTILRQSLSMYGFNVLYQGIQSRLEEIFEVAQFFNVVMISNMDGHAAHYLQSFPELKKRYPCQGTLWYLGGNLHIGDSHDNERIKRKFIELGFDQVFARFVDIQSVLATLEADLAAALPRLGYFAERERKQYFDDLLLNISDERVEPSSWKQARLHVLERWKTGHQAKDMVENAEFLGRQPSFAVIQEQVNEARLPLLIQPRSGVARFDAQMKLFNAFKSCGVRVLSYQVDSLTRNEAYAKVDELLRPLSRNSEADIMLNGFPVVNHGVSTLRMISSSIKLPLQTRHSVRDPRLLAEISYAGGVTSFEGGCICYNIPYYKDYALQDSIRNWQYVDYLTGYYYEKFGIKLDREFFGVLTGTLIPPCLAIVVDVLEALLAVQQGVTCVSLGYAEQGNRVQDIAAIRVLKQVAREVLDNAGYKDVQVNTVFCQYMAAFPLDTQRARELIYQSAITAVLSKATRIITKTPVEAYKIPAMEDNVHALGLVMQALKDNTFADIDERLIQQEEEIITQEFYAIFESVLFCGHGSVTKGIIQAFHKGYIDIPFSPSIYNKGMAMTARDLTGAIRFIDKGNLQFGKDLQEFHADKMQERRTAEGIFSEQRSYQLVEKDVLQIPRHQYSYWPLDRHVSRI